MLHFFISFVGVLALCMGIFCLLAKRVWNKRIRELERNLQSISEAMCQMADVQMGVHSRVTANIADIEERIMDLAVPSHDCNLPLERRHQVLALARQGLTQDDIVKRLNIPRGEAELILDLNRYTSLGSPPTRKTHTEVGHYAQV